MECAASHIHLRPNTSNLISITETCRWSMFSLTMWKIQVFFSNCFSFLTLADALLVFSAFRVVNGITISGQTSRQYTITNATEANAGSYVCIPDGDTTSSFFFDVRFAVAARITQSPADQRVTLGADVNFRCFVNIDAFPKPVVSWTFTPAGDSGSTAAVQNSPSVILADSQQRVHLLNVHTNQSGTYRCHASNQQQGDDSAAATLQVLLPVQVIEVEVPVEAPAPVVPGENLSR